MKRNISDHDVGNGQSIENLDEISIRELRDIFI